MKLHTSKLKTPQTTIRKIEDFGISKYQNEKLSKFTRRVANTLSAPLWNFTQKNWRALKWQEEKLKTLELKKTKTKNLPNSQEERQIPYLPLLWNFTQKIENPQNDKKKIENFGTSKYQKWKLQSSREERQIPLLFPCKISQK